MWYKHVGRNQSLYRLYKEIPNSLKNVRIENITIWDEGNRIKFIFDMPRYVDFPSERWHGDYNALAVEIDFTSIAKLQISTISNTYRGDISINKNSEGLLEVNVVGNLTIHFIADTAIIQCFHPYLYGGDSDSKKYFY